MLIIKTSMLLHHLQILAMFAIRKAKKAPLSVLRKKAFGHGLNLRFSIEINTNSN